MGEGGVWKLCVHDTDAIKMVFKNSSFWVSHIILKLF